MNFSITKTIAVAAIASAVCAGTVQAEPRGKSRRSNANEGDRAAVRQTAGGLIVDSEERYVMLTGSNIPQNVRRKSIGTDGAQNVRIYTQRELQSANGGFGVGGLGLDPSVSISGR